MTGPRTGQADAPKEALIKRLRFASRTRAVLGILAHRSLRSGSYAPSSCEMRALATFNQNFPKLF